MGFIERSTRLPFMYGIVVCTVTVGTLFVSSSIDQNAKRAKIYENYNSAAHNGVRKLMETDLISDKAINVLEKFPLHKDYFYDYQESSAVDNFVARLENFGQFGKSSYDSEYDSLTQNNIDIQQQIQDDEPKQEGNEAPPPVEQKPSGSSTNEQPYVNPNPEKLKKPPETQAPKQQQQQLPVVKDNNETPKKTLPQPNQSSLTKDNRKPLNTQAISGQQPQAPPPPNQSLGQQPGTNNQLVGARPVANEAQNLNKNPIDENEQSKLIQQPSAGNKVFPESQNQVESQPIVPQETGEAQPPLSHQQTSLKQSQSSSQQLQANQQPAVNQQLLPRDQQNQQQQQTNNQQQPITSKQSPVYEQQQPGNQQAANNAQSHVNQQPTVNQQTPTNQQQLANNQVQLLTNQQSSVNQANQPIPMSQNQQSVNQQQFNNVQPPINQEKTAVNKQQQSGYQQQVVNNAELPAKSPPNQQSTISQQQGAKNQQITNSALPPINQQPPVNQQPPLSQQQQPTNLQQVTNNAPQPLNQQPPAKQQQQSGNQQIQLTNNKQPQTNQQSPVIQKQQPGNQQSQPIINAQIPVNQQSSVNQQPPVSQQQSSGNKLQQPPNSNVQPHVNQQSPANQQPLINQQQNAGNVQPQGQQQDANHQPLVDQQAPAGQQGLAKPSSDQQQDLKQPKIAPKQQQQGPSPPKQVPPGQLPLNQKEVPIENSGGNQGAGGVKTLQNQQGAVSTATRTTRNIPNSDAPEEGEPKFAPILRADNNDNEVCMSIKLAPRGSFPLVPLLSAPGSGNTWTRFLIEHATGIFTGSVYVDAILYKGGFLGEMEEVDAGTTIVTKTHYFPQDEKFNLTKTILIIRNPFNAILSEFNRQYGPHGVNQSHVSFADPTLFKTENWTRYAKGASKRWFKLIERVMTKLNATNRLVIYYESLQEDVAEPLRQMVEFLQVPLDERRLECTKRISNSSNFHRPHKSLTFDPFDENLTKEIEDSIERAREIMLMYKLPTPLPRYTKDQI